MKEKLWLFIVKFILVSALVFFFWHLSGALERRGTLTSSEEPGWYIMLLNYILSFLLIKLAGFNIQYFPVPKPVLLNLIPFISLMIITREIKLKTKLTKLVLGLLILIGWHMVMTMVVYFLHEGYQITYQAYEKLSVPLYLFNGTLPFILWILFASKQIAGLFLRKKKPI